MMNLILMTFAIYVALVGASVTIMMLAMSKWYINKTKRMTKDLMNEFEDET